MNPETAPAPALSEERLIEAVAVEVMRWTKWKGAWPTGGVWKDGNEDRTWLDWNPLTDWNHTMEVVAEMQQRGYSWRIVHRPIRGQPYAEFFFEHSKKWGCFLAKDPQRAICLAALQAVRSSASA